MVIYQLCFENKVKNGIFINQLNRKEMGLRCKKDSNAVHRRANTGSNQKRKLLASLADAEKLEDARIKSGKYIKI